MTIDVVLSLIVQSIVIIGTIVIAFFNLKIAVAKLETKCAHIDKNIDQLKNDYIHLADQVNGISRHVATIEGARNASSQNQANNG